MRSASVGLVPLGRARCRHHRMRARANIYLNIKVIAARNPARRMHDHRVTDRLTFGIKRSLNPQRPIVQPMHECRTFMLLDEAEFEACPPWKMRGGLSGGERNVIFVKRHACVK
jgi:hypothetical protein